jgi:photosynthetic reaction center H subunit
MPKGSITEFIDVAQVAIYLFWIFFAGLVYYLLRENKREGYPLAPEGATTGAIQGFPAVPQPKTYILPEGGTISAPRAETDTRPIKAEPIAPWPGAPLEPVGNPMIDGVGPAAWAMRSDNPDMTADGRPRIVPLSVALDFSIEHRDPDPRGMEVVGADGLIAGTVSDVWVDRSESLIRYLAVVLPAAAPKRDELAPAPRHVLLPMNFSRVDGRRRQVRVKSILARHFADVPSHRSPTQISRREEDRITAYYGGGHLYALASRTEAQL